MNAFYYEKKGHIAGKYDGYEFPTTESQGDIEKTFSVWIYKGIDSDNFETFIKECFSKAGKELIIEDTNEDILFEKWCNFEDWENLAKKIKSGATFYKAIVWFALVIVVVLFGFTGAILIKEQYTWYGVYIFELLIGIIWRLISLL